MVPPTSGRNGHVYLVSAMRTPIGRFGGALSGIPAVELGGVAIRAAVTEAGLPEGTPIDEVLMGQVLQAGCRAGAGAAGAPSRGAAGDHIGHHDQPGLWLGAEVDHARRRRDQGG